MPTPTIAREPAEVPGLINGRAPGSSYEWRVAVSLWKYKWAFEYQVSYFGGRSLRGGQVIDFLVLTVPLPTPLYVYGEYWHSSVQSEKDKLQRALLTNYLHGQIAEPVILYGAALHSQETTDEAIYQIFGRGG